MCNADFASRPSSGRFLAARAGGIGLIPLAIPPIAAGYGVVRRAKPARWLGFLIAALYGSVVAYVAIVPRGGLTPAPGAEPTAIDPGSVIVVIAFLAAAVLLALGKLED